MIYTDGFNLALIPLVDSGNSEDSVDEKLAEGFFERKISGSKRRESERFVEIAEDSISYFHPVEWFK